jgi:hypothetical protein
MDALGWPRVHSRKWKFVHGPIEPQYLLAHGVNPASLTKTECRANGLSYGKMQRMDTNPVLSATARPAEDEQSVVSPSSEESVGQIHAAGQSVG